MLGITVCGRQYFLLLVEYPVFEIGFDYDMAEKIISDKLSEFTLMMNEFMSMVQKTIKEGFERQIDYLNKEIFDLHTKCSKNERDLSELRDENEELRSTVDFLRRKVDTIEYSQDEAQQDALMNDIVLSNVPSESISNDPDSEKIVNIINKCAMGQVISKDEVRVKRAFKARNDPSKSTVILTLDKVLLKNAILTQKKLFASRGIFCRENLTPRRHRLLALVRKECKDNDIKFTWAKEGRIFIRRNESANIVSVKSISDVLKYANDS